jgi:hypothetical protein
MGHFFFSQSGSTAEILKTLGPELSLARQLATKFWYFVFLQVQDIGYCMVAKTSLFFSLGTGGGSRYCWWKREENNNHVPSAANFELKFEFGNSTKFYILKYIGFHRAAAVVSFWQFFWFPTGSSSWTRESRPLDPTDIYWLPSRMGR